MKKILLAVALAATLFVGNAVAATTTNLPGDADVTPLPDNKTSFAPGVQIILPALAQNDSVVTYIPFDKYYTLWSLGSSAPTGGFFVSVDLSAAADSVAVIGGIGQRVGGPFNSPFSAGLQVWTRTTATPQYGVITATTAVWAPGRLFRVIMKSKGATAIEAGRKAYIRFPRQVVPQF